MWQKIKISLKRHSGEGRNPENCQVTPTAQPNLQAVHGFGQAQFHTKFHIRLGINPIALLSCQDEF
jgi:hypothetical protein